LIPRVPFGEQGQGPAVAPEAPGPLTGYCAPGSSRRRGRGQIGIGMVLIVCQAVVRSGVQGQPAGRRRRLCRTWRRDADGRPPVGGGHGP
jgi:hypothetical protein